MSMLFQNFKFAASTGKATIGIVLVIVLLLVLGFVVMKMMKKKSSKQSMGSNATMPQPPTDNMPQATMPDASAQAPMPDPTPRSSMPEEPTIAPEPPQSPPTSDDPTTPQSPTTPTAQVEKMLNINSSFLATAYSYNYSTTNGKAVLAILLPILAIALIVGILILVSTWKIFTKA